MNIKRFFRIVPLLMLITSCNVYHISSESLVQQFDSAHVEKKAAPMLMYKTVNGNDLTSIRCPDKKGKEKVYSIDNRTAVKITRTNGSHVQFYFDTMILKDGMITGSKTHFFHSGIHPIPIDSIAKIEISQ